jgi:hypothetical protein
VVSQTVTCEVPFSLPPNTPAVLFVPLKIGPGDVELTNIAEVSSPGTSTVTSSFTSQTTSNLPSFEFLDSEGLTGSAFESDGEPAVSGSHPWSVQLRAELPSVGGGVTEGIRALEPLRSLSFTLPAGLVVNPEATPVRCTRAQFESESRVPEDPREREHGAGLCPAESQVGSVTFDIPGLENTAGLWNLIPQHNVPAEFGATVFGTQVRIRGGLNGSYQLEASTSELLSKYQVLGAVVELWGLPSSAEHDRARDGGQCHNTGGCPVTRTNTPLLTMPSACSTDLSVGASATGWLGGTAAGERPFTTATGQTESVTGCEHLGFEPTVTAQPESKAAESPTGLSVDIKVPQNEGFYGLASATLKKAVVRLPQGMRINPPAANGLGACSMAQIGIGNTQVAACPSGSVLGTAEVTTPLLPKPLTGKVFLAEQGNNPFATLLALYLVVEGEGVVIKLPGRVDADPQNGQLTATFDNNPQLPFEDLKVQFFGGSGAPRAALVTPATCGTYSIGTELTSWASPTPVSSSSQFVVDQNCSTGGFSPRLSGGTANPVAGRYSGFTLQITREDGEQNLQGVSATLPEGLLAKLGGVPLCGDAEAADGNCPPASQIGSTDTGVGAGPQPLYIPQPGKAPTAVYLAGPYKGAPYSLVIKVPAQAGPFDLGTITVRAALEVDPFTTQVTATADPLPQFLEGIPVAYRDVRVNVDRPDFMLNPTSCEPMKITSKLVSAAGMTATPSERFQVAGCEGLGFKPKLKLQLKGPTKRVGHPAVKAVVTYPKKGAYANVARAQVGLPPAEFLDQGNLSQVCKQADLRAGTCPASTIYGRAKAWSPLLDRPLEGPVYLGVGFGYKLPALVADLNGKVRILLKGRIDTTKQRGLRTTFEAVPDAPVSRFVLELKGGKKYGLLENSENLCKKPQRASVLFNGQNGKQEQLSPKVANSCKGNGRKKQKK